MRVVLCYPVQSRHVEQFEKTLTMIQEADTKIPLDQFEVVNAGQEGIAEALPTADIFIGHAKVPVDWDRTVQGGRLQLIQSSAAGLDHCLVPSVIESNIPVASASGLFAPQVAEQTMALLFGLLRRLPTFALAEQKREFIRRPTDDLRGKTVGIVGLGGNGRYLADVLSKWEIKIVATDFYPVDPPSSVQQLWPHDKLDELLACSDIVIATLPLYEQTKGLFDASRFASMKPGAYFINVARGGVVVESDLIAALDSEHLSGAGVDVTEVEPLSADSPLWERENVIITPHVGAQSFRRVDDTTDLACENMVRFFNGKKPYNVVDKRLGFPHPNDTIRCTR